MDDMEEGKGEKKKGVLGYIALFFKAIYAFLRFLSFLLKFSLQIFSLFMVVIVIWMGYRVYDDFDKFKKGGMNDESAIVESLDVNMGQARDFLTERLDALRGLEVIPKEFLNNEEKPILREEYIRARGIPQVYMILNSSDKLSEKGIPVQRDEVLRLEVWIYGPPYNKKVVFENGFLREEKDVNQEEGFSVNSLSPLSLNEKTSIEDVKKLLGNPTCILDDGPIRTLRFEDDEKRPLVSVTFKDNKMISATVGIAFLGEKKGLCE